MIKEIFTWWNKQTFGTRLNTLLFGKLVGEELLKLAGSEFIKK